MKNFLNRIQTKFSIWMNGRNGRDELVTAACFAGVVCLIFSVLSRRYKFYLLALFLWGYTIFRICSKNLAKRRLENENFQSLFGNFYKIGKKYISLIKLSIKERKTSRFFLCKKCGQIIRIPKGKGTIEISCPKCRNHFLRRT